MIKPALCLSFLLTVFATAYAEDANVEAQIASIKEKIMEEEALQQQLKDEIASKDEEVMQLREQLKVLEEQVEDGS